jgi:hypothetical protein
MAARLWSPGNRSRAAPAAGDAQQPARRGAFGCGERGDGAVRAVGYDFRVIVVNAAGDSLPSNVVTVVL